MLLRAILLLALCAPLGAEKRTTLGIYIWGQLAQDLPTAVTDAKRLGLSEAVRVYIGPFWDPLVPDDSTPIAQKLLRHDYQAVLAAYPTVMFTAYAAAGRTSYRQPAEPMDLPAVRAEFADFAYELGRLPGRYIVSNWEFEHDCPVPAGWPRCLAHEQARVDGLIAGRDRARADGFPGNVSVAFEFTIIPGFVGRPSGLVEIGARLRGVDYWSYSSWWSIQEYDPPTMAASFAWAFRFIRSHATNTGSSAGLILGEFGDLWDQHPSIDRLLAMIEACNDWGVEYAFNWMLYDQPGALDQWGRDASRYGKYDLSRTLTVHGRAFRKLFVPAHRPWGARRKPSGSSVAVSPRTPSWRRSRP